MALSVAARVSVKAPVTARRTSRRAAALVVRAEAENAEGVAPVEPAAPAPVAAVPEPVVAAPAPAAVKALTFGEAMAFSAAPEIINGRLAMLGLVAAIGAELATGKSTLTQLACEPWLIGAVVALFSWASLVPLLLRGEAAKKEYSAFGPFTQTAEMINGRAAMIGLASLLAIESIRHTALF